MARIRNKRRTRVFTPRVHVAEIAASGRTITGVESTITVFLGATLRGAVNRAVPITSFMGFEQSFGGLSAALDLPYAVRQYFLNGGREAWVVRIARQVTTTRLRAGLKALDAIYLVNLLVLPGITEPNLLAAAVAYARGRRATVIVDPPATAIAPGEILQALQKLNFAHKEHAALYYPWIKVADPLNRRTPRLSPPSGTIAGLIARTDKSRGVWKAPAGTAASLKGVTALNYDLSDAETSRLNPRGINCLRSLPGAGIVAWGARTVAGGDAAASEFKYLPVHRMAMFLEESVTRGTQWAAFEPNAEPLWAQLRQTISAFLQDLFRQGAFSGANSNQGFLVKCGRETTSPADIAAGKVNILVGFAPLKPAEFVLVNIRQSTQRPR